MADARPPESSTLELLRRLLLGLLLFSTVGVLAELYLLEHYSARWQWAPIYLLGAGIPVVAWALLRPSTASVRTLRILMALFVLAGAVGFYMHYNGNVEFEREIYPDKAGMELVWDALTGAFPALAPGTMSLLGGIGLIATIRHPRG